MTNLTTEGNDKLEVTWQYTDDAMANRLLQVLEAAPQESGGGGGAAAESGGAGDNAAESGGGGGAAE
jgi:hypothetical protein